MNTTQTAAARKAQTEEIKALTGGRKAAVAVRTNNNLVSTLTVLNNVDRVVTALTEAGYTTSTDETSGIALVTVTK
jgi:hypothetical protein